TNPALKAGEVRITEENGRSVINLSEADAAKSSELVPWLHKAVEERTPVGHVQIEAALARTQVARRTRDAALGLPTGGLRGPRVFETRSTALLQAATGYTRRTTVTDATLASNAAKLERLGPSIVVSRESANSYSVIAPSRVAEASLGPQATQAEARDLESVTELLAESYVQGNFGVHLKGVTPEEALAFRKTAEYQIEAQTGRKVEIDAFVEQDGNLTERSYAALSETHYDYAHPKISAPEITEISDGPVRGT